MTTQTHNNAVPNAADGAQKLATIIKPFLDELEKRLTEKLATTTQEILIEVQGVKAQVAVLEKLVSEKKKAAPRGEKKTATEATAPTTPGAETPILQPAGAKKVFPGNKLIWFRENFKTKKEFRERFITPGMQSEMDKDETISGRKTDEAKLTSMSSWCWAYIKANQPDVTKVIEADYGAEKQAHEAANKPPQQTVEAKTPPETTG